MKLTQGRLRLEKPLRFARPQVIIDVKKLFIALTDAVVQGSLISTTAGGSIPNIATALSSGLDAVSIASRGENIAWRLIVRSLHWATWELVSEYNSKAAINIGDRKNLEERLEILMEGGDITLTKDFLSQPQSLSIFSDFQKIFEDWLRFANISEGQTKQIAHRLGSYFCYALAQEWRSHSHNYPELLSFFDTPFSGAERDALDWECYRQRLIREMEIPLFEESFGLREVFIALRATKSVHNRDRASTRKAVVDVISEVVAWLSNAADASGSIRLISGGPACGKSSIVKFIAARAANGEIAGIDRCFVLPLQRFPINERLKDAVGRYLVESEEFSTSPLNRTPITTSSGRLLLIFDGLDELAKPGRLAENDATNFMAELRSQLDLWNSRARTKVFALVTGRTAAVQHSAQPLRLKDNHFLNVLPYYLTDHERVGLEADGVDLAEDQRLQWWARYQTAKSGSLDPVPEFLKQADLDELTREPLLLYLFVIDDLYRKLDASTTLNRSRLYKLMFDDVISRRHGDQVPLAAIDDAGGPDVAERLLATIALAAWYGDGRSATVEEIEACCPSDLRRALSKFQQDDQRHNISRLIAAFYFQKSERGRHRDAFEFTHKTFGEYLTARRLVWQIDRIREGFDCAGSYYDLRTALLEWQDLTGRQSLDYDLYRFIEDELRLEEWSLKLEALSQALTKMFEFVLNNGIPSSVSSVQSTIRHESGLRNAEASLLAVLAACARARPCKALVNWPDPYAAIRFCKRVIANAQREVMMGPNSWSPLHTLQYFDLKDQVVVVTGIVENPDSLDRILKSADAGEGLANLPLANKLLFGGRRIPMEVLAIRMEGSGMGSTIVMFSGEVKMTSMTTRLLEQVVSGASMIVLEAREHRAD